MEGKGTHVTKTRQLAVLLTSVYKETEPSHVHFELDYKLQYTFKGGLLVT